MIVKNTALSSTAVSWRAPVASPPLRAVVERQESAVPEKAHEVRQFDSPHREVPAQTLATVCDWLEKQPANTRLAVAESLAEELAELREAARVEGVEKGRQQGLGEARAAQSRAIDLLAAASADCQAALERELATMGECTIVVLEEVLRKIAGPLLASREAIAGAVIEVIGRLKHESRISIRVSNLDMPVLREFEASIAAALGDRRYEMVADSSISGGCAIDSNLGSLDGRLELQLQELLDLIAHEKRLTRTS